MFGYCILGTLLLTLCMLCCVKIAQVIIGLSKAHEARCLCDAAQTLQAKVEEVGEEAGVFRGPQSFRYVGPDGQPQEARRGSELYEEILDSF